MGYLIRTEKENELDAIIDGLEDQAEDLERKAHRVEGNVNICGAVGAIATGLAFAIDHFPEAPPNEKYFVLGTAGAFIAGAIKEHYRLERLYVKADKKRKLADQLRLDPDYEPHNFEVYEESEL